MYRLPIALFVPLLSMASAAEVHSNDDKPSAFKKPSFVHGLDTPVYTVVDKTDDYELRTYAPSKWVSTTIEGYGFVEAQRQGFMKLFNYISGENARKQKIDMTAPVRTLVTPGDGPFCVNKFTVSFFVPYALTDNIPAPTSPGVFVESTPELTVYVSSFGGFMSESDIIDEAAKLQQTLRKKRLFVDSSTFYACGYDSPFRLFWRHNEVWLKAKGSTKPIA